MTLIFALAALVLFGYAVYVRLSDDETVPIQSRVWAAVISAGAAVGAAVMSLVSP